MAIESYRVPDFSLQHRIENHEFGKRVASAAFFPFRLNLALIEAYAAAFGFKTPHKEEERGVVIPISEFPSFYGRRKV